MIKSFIKTTIKNSIYKKARYVEEIIMELPIEKVFGNAILTHIGPHGRLQFIFNGKEYQTSNSFRTIGADIALALDETSAIYTEKLSFDVVNFGSLWSKYNQEIRTEGFWMAIK